MTTLDAEILDQIEAILARRRARVAEPTAPVIVPSSQHRGFADEHGFHAPIVVGGKLVAYAVIRNRMIVNSYEVAS
jgi:hypothetical protein